MVMNTIACATPFPFPTFGEVLVRRRMERGWSIAKLAREAMVSRQAIYDWERGKAVPIYPYRLALREALRLSEHDDGGYWGKW